ncbi:polyprotein [Baakal virus]|uniref:Envelopment polyprotein n=1 Tax=Baakal virus TaxID=2609058 RepID=A0A5C2D3A8_9VIRU|nr:polyprotein [Baakal virus]QEO75949.1 polyprotein [Baakal virus]
MTLATYLLIFIIITYEVNSSTIRCFSGGFKIKEEWSVRSASDICLKDDISQIKIIVDHKKNDTGIFALNQAWRKWIIEDWYACNPKKTSMGPISIIDVGSDFTLVSHSYSCDRPCTISLDRDNAEVILQSNGLNYFELSGTTIKTGWFKTSATIKLDQTCEHVKVTCGSKSLQFHACFRNHMACIRFLHGTILPGQMATSICQNIELILMTTFTLIIFTILTILMKTYICYLLMPLFMPIAYVYGFVYDRACKKCQLCGLAYHPFTKCGNHCVCGCRFEGSESMKKHRELGRCPGYKSTSTARALCKSRGSAFSLALILSVLALGFITPIQGLAVLDNRDAIKINELSEEFLIMQTEINLYKTVTIINAAWTYTMIGLAVIIWILFKRYQHRFLNVYAMYCRECDMYHERSGIKYNGDFTNKCGSCTCGEFEDMAGLTQHKKKATCIEKYKTRWVFNWLIIILSLCFIKDSMILAAAQKTDLKKCIQNQEITEPCTGPLLDLGPCSPSEKAKSVSDIAKQMQSDDFISELDLQIIELLNDNIASDLKLIENEADPHRQRLLEYIFLQKHCDYYTTFNSPTSYSQTVWHYYLKTNKTKFCQDTTGQTLNPCKCLIDQSTTGCDTDIKSNAKTYYQSKSTELESDFTLYIKLFKTAFPGSASVYFINHTTETGLAKLKIFLGNISAKYKTNNKVQAFVQLGLAILENITKPKLEPELAIPTPMSVEIIAARAGGTTDMLITNFNQTIFHDQLLCQNPSELICISPKSKNQLDGMLICLYSGKYQLVETKTKYYKSGGVLNTHVCAVDTYCAVKYELASDQRVKDLFKNRCWRRPYITPEDYISKGRQLCQVIARAECIRLSKSPQKILKCDDGHYYPDLNGPVPFNANRPDTFCLSNPCGKDIYPFDTTTITNCTWINPRLVPGRVNNVVHRTFDSFKESLIKKIQSDMTINKFGMTQNLPYFIPKYKYISLKGVETTNGVENSYIYTEIPALTGSSMGLKILSPDGIEILDIIIYVRVSKITASYEYKYYTGKTIAINVEHEEKCTGSCPTTIPHKNGWATFSKERSSNWGCEEFGCLAVQTGCVYGSCQDIIKKEFEIYSKSEDDKTITEVCMSMSHKTYCSTVDATAAVMTPEFELQYKTIETNTLPKLIAMSNHQLYIGQINELGSFGRYCGNLQVLTNTTLGQADVKFDYICHAASRKDIIIRKCLNNNAQSCNTLRRDEDLIFDEKDGQVVLYNNRKLTGTISIKAMLGDFDYKLYTEEFTADMEANCIGCFNCISGITCSVKIRSEIKASCKISAPCPSFTSRIVINKGPSEHILKLTCPLSIKSADIRIKVCSTEVIGHLTVTESHDNLQLSTGEQSTYIHEEDMRCKTWICKVQEEGLSAIVRPIKEWLGEFTWPITTLIAVIILLFLAIYIFMPMCMKLKDLLKKNEYEHMQELKVKYASNQVAFNKNEDKIRILANKPLV